LKIAWAVILLLKHRAIRNELYSTKHSIRTFLLPGKPVSIQEKIGKHSAFVRVFLCYNILFRLLLKFLFAACRVNKRKLRSPYYYFSFEIHIIGQVMEHGPGRSSYHRQLTAFSPVSAFQVARSISNLTLESPIKTVVSGA
jgi:hypothetical protein